jgi:hypothetical protein
MSLRLFWPPFFPAFVVRPLFLARCCRAPVPSGTPNFFMPSRPLQWVLTPRPCPSLTCPRGSRPSGNTFLSSITAPTGLPRPLALMRVPYRPIHRPFHHPQVRIPPTYTYPSVPGAPPTLPAPATLGLDHLGRPLTWKACFSGPNRDLWLDLSGAELLKLVRTTGSLKPLFAPPKRLHTITRYLAKSGRITRSSGVYVVPVAETASRLSTLSLPLQLTSLQLNASCTQRYRRTLSSVSSTLRTSISVVLCLSLNSSSSILQIIGQLFWTT